MGADLMITLVPEARGPDGNGITEITPAVEAAVLARVQQIDVETAQCLFEDNNFEGIDSDFLNEDGPDDAHGFLFDAAMQVLELQIHGDGDVTSSPDFVIVVLGGRRYLATGGWSWGEYPTDSYAPIAIVDEANLFDEPFEF